MLSCQLLALEFELACGPQQGEPARKRRRTKSDAGFADRDEEGTAVQGGEAAASILRGEACACMLAGPRPQEQACQAPLGLLARIQRLPDYRGQGWRH